MNAFHVLTGFGLVLAAIMLVAIGVAQAYIRPHRVLWRVCNILAFCGVIMIFGGLFAAGLVTTPTAPRSEFGTW